MCLLLSFLRGEFLTIDVMLILYADYDVFIKMSTIPRFPFQGRNTHKRYSLRGLPPVLLCKYRGDRQRGIPWTTTTTTRKIQKKGNRLGRFL